MNYRFLYWNTVYIVYNEPIGFRGSNCRKG